MIHFFSRLIGGVLVSLMLAVGSLGTGGVPVGVAEAQGSAIGPCGLSQPAFCETFDQPAGTGNRSGQLNGTLWGVSRTIGGAGTNFGQGQFNGWYPTHLQTCGGTILVHPNGDVTICNGQLRESVNDATDVLTLAMYPKQPFDFAGRTGTVVFDVSNDTQGTHTTWPELWITDQPVPTPFTHFAAWIAAPRNGFGLRFGAATSPGQGYTIAPACPNDANNRWSVDSVVVSRNYVLDDQANHGAAHVTMLDCVIASSGPGNMNHVEVHVSQDQVDVYATDAGTLAPLHHIAVVQNANLSFTRGLIWLEDVHYNADKFGLHNQREHTFAWDNVGFDGQVLPRDLTFDALDALTPVANYPGQLNLGWRTQPGAGPQLSIPGVTGIEHASAALLLFNFFHYSAPRVLSYTVNGYLHTEAWPYPETTPNTWRTVALPVPLTDLVADTNTVKIWSDTDMALANVDILLVGAGGFAATPPAVPDASPAPPPAVPDASPALAPAVPEASPAAPPAESDASPASPPAESDLGTEPSQP